jgi:hypothetical protein
MEYPPSVDIRAVDNIKLLVDKQEIYERAVVALIAFMDYVDRIHSGAQSVNAVCQVGDIYELTW